MRTEKARRLEVMARRFVLATGSSPSLPPIPGLAAAPYLTPAGSAVRLVGRLDNLVVLRGFTKAYSLGGLRCGYALGPVGVIARLAAAQPLWPVSSLALAACVACVSEPAVAAASSYAASLAADRDALVAMLSAVPGVRVVPSPAASFVLLRHSGSANVRERLRDRGFAVRRGDTFPGLGASWLRVAVREPAVSAVTPTRPLGVPNM